MKRSANFLMREVAGSWVVVPVGQAAREFSGMMRLNSTGRFLWDLLEQEQTEGSLVAALLERYDVSEDVASKDVAAFLEQIRSTGALDEHANLA